MMHIAYKAGQKDKETKQDRLKQAAAVVANSLSNTGKKNAAWILQKELSMKKAGS